MSTPLSPLPGSSRMPNSRLFSTRRRQPRPNSQTLSTRILHAVLMGCVVSLVVWLALAPLSLAFADIVIQGAGLLDLPAMLQQEALNMGDKLVLTRFGLADEPVAVSDADFMLHVLGIAAVLVAGSRLRRVPVRHAVFAVCALHLLGASVAWLQGDAFPHNMLTHTRLVADTNLLWLAISPVMLTIGFYVVERSWVNRVLATALFLGWQVFALPLKVLLSAVLIQTLTPAIIPLLFVAAGPMLDVLLMAALYAWFMTWPLLQLDERGRLATRPDLQVSPPK
ncbi:MAG: hypothetical protein QM776_02045 [Rhodocyclaceae bacterium]